MTNNKNNNDNKTIHRIPSTEDRKSINESNNGRTAFNDSNTVSNTAAAPIRPKGSDSSKKSNNG